MELARSYKTVIDGLGGEELSYDEQGGRLVARFTRNGQNVYVKLASNGAGEYILTVVEERPFRPMIQQSAPSSKP